jgi:hypothetical protein
MAVNTPAQGVAMNDPTEVLVRWYLRFNGYLSAENFTLHEPSEKQIPSGGEFDILSVRFPFSNEAVPDHELARDQKLEDAVVKEANAIDFLIAEVKRGQANLNSIWLPSDEEGEKKGRIAYMIRWLGPLADDADIAKVASDLQTTRRSLTKGCLFRVVVFANSRNEEVQQLGAPIITFWDVASFLVKFRIPCWEEWNLGFRSDHSQWEPLIKKAWDSFTPQDPDPKNIRNFLKVFGLK